MVEKVVIFTTHAPLEIKCMAETQLWIIVSLTPLISTYSSIANVQTVKHTHGFESLHVSICALLLQKNQFCEVPWGPGAGHWVDNGIVWPIPCGISKAFKSCFPNPGPAVISPVLQSATLILCALQMVDSFHEPQDPLGKTYPWTHLDTQTTILEQESRKRCYGIMIWSRVNILHLQNQFFHHRILTFVTVNLSKNLYPVVISCSHPAPPVPHLQPGNTWEAPTLKSVSNAKPRKRIPTTNGTSAAMRGMIKIYCGWWKKSPPSWDGSKMFKPYKSWDIYIYIDGINDRFQLVDLVHDLLLQRRSSYVPYGLPVWIFCGHVAGTCWSSFHRFCAWLGTK